MNANNTDWQSLAKNILYSSRILFLGTIIWEFVLTVIIQTSQRSFILTGAIPELEILLSVIWFLAIVFLSIAILRTISETANEDGSELLEYIGLTAMCIVYANLLFLTFMSPVLLWIFILNYFVSMMWAVSLIYFRKRYSVLLNKNRGETESN